MIRKIFLFLLLAGFVALSAFFFYKFNEKKPIENDSYAAVPTQSIWVMEIRNSGSLFSTLKGTNIIYDELIQNDVWQSWTSYFAQLDSVVSLEPLKYEMYKEVSMVMALVPSGAESSDLLLSIRNPNDVEESRLFEDLIKPLVGNSSPSNKDYDGATINSYSTGNSSLLFVSLYKGYTLLSLNQIVIEDAIRQLNSDVSLAIDERFKKVMATAGNSRNVNWYVNQKAFAKYLSTFIDKHHNHAAQNGFGLSQWMELDLWLKPNSLMFNGYCYSGNDKSSFTEVFNGQVAGANGVIEILPISTAFFINYNFSNYSDFNSSYQAYLKALNQFVTYSKNLNELNDSAQINTAEILFKNVGSEVCLAVLEVQNSIDGKSVSSVYDKTVSILRLKNSDVWTDEMVSLIKANETDELFKSEYREVPIYEMNVSGFVANNLSGIFKGLENKYFIVIDEYVIFGEKVATLREVINAWKGDKVLSEDDHFESFSENMASNSNVTLFASPARSPHLVSYFLNSGEQNWISDKLELFRKFEGLAIQITKENEGMDYYSVFLKHNPIYKKVTSSLWEIPLDTQILSSPQLFENHYTKAGEILVQDVNNKLYLISNTGRVLWSRQINGNAMSSFYKVDKFKNDKFQILFNTSDQIYLIDRNGKNVKGFPIKLKGKASGPLSIMDYDRNRKYRLLQPLQDGSIRCFDVNGKEVKGWGYKGKVPVERKLVYIKHKGKDYIVSFYNDGSVKALNRRGQTRLKFKEKFNLSKNSMVRTQLGNKLGSIYLVGTDSSGNVMRLSLSDKLELLQFGNFSSSHYFTTADVDGDKIAEYIFQDKDRFVAYSESGDQVLKIESDFIKDNRPGVYRSEINNYVAITASEKDNVWLYNNYGEKIDGNPFLGSSRPILYDINLDGRLELITTSSVGMVYCYVLN